VLKLTAMPGHRQRLERDVAEIEALSEDERTEDVAMEYSNLATKLLMATAMGNMSYHASQQIAYGAYLDGLRNTEICDLASAGTWGQNPSHIKRDIQAKFFKNVSYAEPEPITTMAFNTKSGEVIPVDHFVFNPHEIFSSIFEYQMVGDAVFRTDEVSNFWRSVSKTDPKLISLCSAMKWGMEDLQKVIPILVHGDGVEYIDGDSLEINSMGPLLGTGNSLDCLFTLSVFPYSCAVKTGESSPGTWDPAWTKFCWSINAGMSGKHPTHDHLGELLDPQSRLGKKAGQNLTPEGWRFCVWAISGDHEHHANLFGMPHWASESWCWGCNASKSQNTGLQFTAKGPTHCRLATLKQELKSRRSKHRIFTVPGITRFNVQHDPLHVFYHNGILGHFFGSFIHELIWVEGPGHQKLAPQHRLSVLWQRVQELHKERKTSTRVTSLQLSMIANTKAPHAGFPYLRLSASETKHLVPIIAQVAAEVHQPSCPRSHHKLQAAIAIQQFCDLLDSSGPVPTAAEARAAVASMGEFLSNYQALHDWAIENNRMLYHVVPKFHMAWHMAYEFEYLNPRFAWTFKCEDYVGQISKLGHDCTFGMSRMNVSRPICGKIRHCTHLRLDRGDFTDD